MSRVCELTGKSVMSGNNVSHAINKTRRRFLPNLQRVSLPSEALGRALRLRISTHALRSVEHRGGIDAFLMNAADKDLSPKAQKLKKLIVAKMALIRKDGKAIYPFCLVCLYEAAPRTGRAAVRTPPRPLAWADAPLVD